MNTENPFQVAESCSGAIPVKSPFTSPTMFRIEGDVLVCGTSVVLPRVCVLGKADENLISQTQQVQFAALRPVLLQRACSVTYFVSRSKTRLRPVMIVISLIAAIAAAIFLTSSSQGSGNFFLVVIFAVWLLTMVMQVSRPRRAVRLKLDSYDAPGIYRIRGFPRKYLDTINKVLAGLPTDPPENGSP